MAQVQLEVTELTSSVIASKRNFACQNEETVYRCVANSTTMDVFQTIWTWNNSFVKSFTSTEIIGQNNTCISDESLRFLHSTLVYTAPTSCVSLLIVIPSLPDYNDVSVPVECEAIADGIEPQKMTVYHTTISGESCAHVNTLIRQPCMHTTTSIIYISYLPRYDHHEYY